MRTEILVVLSIASLQRTFSMDSYWEKRNDLIEKERFLSLGGDIKLSERELMLNERLLRLKEKELNEINCPAFSQFVAVHREIENNSDVFKCLKRLPKGGCLHVHLFASVSYDYVKELLKRENLFLFCDENERLKFKFLDEEYKKDCDRVSKKLKEKDFDEWLENNLVLNRDDITKNLNETWNKFKKIFTLTYDLFTYVGVFEDYVYEILKEHYEDNVLYLEIKAPFVYLYELNGTTHDEEFFIDSLYKVNNKFKKDHPDFIGFKYICAFYRNLTQETLTQNLSTLKKLKLKYPDFVIGFDLVGFEGDAPLTTNIETIKNIGIDFYFHAGETNNFGDNIDENLLDAILLGSKRIGHAFSLPKHPQLQKIVKETNTAIEVCPISNQVLKLISDLRNHPAANFIASGLPVVICNDDPGNWFAKGLSYDFYMVFMAMTHRKSGLEFLKKVSWNSIQYSGMNDDEKRGAFVIFEEKWEKFINESINL